MRGFCLIGLLVLFLGFALSVSYTKGEDLKTSSALTMPRQKNAAREEIQKIHTRGRIRDLQLQNTIQLYAELKRLPDVHSHKNTFKDQFIFRQTLKITQDIFLDNQADQMRLRSLQDAIPSGQ